ncbi:MAG: hypothetical protein GX146_05295 [Myxococcales bacterium]|nr:hypothetical protein [Myxococcales bacterium]
MTIQEFVTRVADDRRRNIITYIFRCASVGTVVGFLPKEVRDEIFRGLLKALRYEYQLDISVKGLRSKHGTIYHKYFIKGFGSDNRILDKDTLCEIHDQLVAAGAHRPYGVI